MNAQVHSRRTRSSDMSSPAFHGSIFCNKNHCPPSSSPPSPHHHHHHETWVHLHSRNHSYAATLWMTDWWVGGWKGGGGEFPNKSWSTVLQNSTGTAAQLFGHCCDRVMVYLKSRAAIVLPLCDFAFSSKAAMLWTPWSTHMWALVVQWTVSSRRMWTRSSCQWRRWWIIA